MEKDGNKKRGNLTIRLDNELLEKYRNFCEEKGYDMSKRLRLFIENEINSSKTNNIVGCPNCSSVLQYNLSNNGLVLFSININL